MLLIGTVVGALVGLLVGGSIGAWYLAFLAGFLGTIIAVIMRNLILSRGAGLGPDDSRTPVLVIVYAAVASLAPAALPSEFAQHSGLGGAPVLDRHDGRLVRLDPALVADDHLSHQSRTGAQAALGPLTHSAGAGRLDAEAGRLDQGEIVGRRRYWRW